ncbi:MAG: PhoH family protein [Planctomycetes bacterium]|nr:PhoH family protein [Planctomycetota bacterium]
MQKTFILDTNVLLHSAEALESFADNHIVLPMSVIEELDKFKSHNDELGRNSRRVIRRIDSLREKGSLKIGVPTEPGGTLRIISAYESGQLPGLDYQVMDNRIIRVAYGLHCNKKEGEEVIFVSKDINARVKADALGIEAQDFEKQKINFDELYSGYCEIQVPSEVVDQFYDTDIMEVPGAVLYPNEFVLLKDESNPKHTALAKALEDSMVTHLNSKFDYTGNIKPRSKEQRMAVELLLDPTIHIVTLVGQAGTGKTLLALAAALQSTIKYAKYNHILVTRPIIPMGKDIGYLPGAKDEKLSHWMQPIFDNLTYLMQEGDGGGEDGKKAQKKVDELMKDGTISMEALTYIRGRSIPRQYVIVDEAQNLTPHEVKTIISRAGEDTKMILTGDPYQIDNPYLDSASNGLTYTVERLKSHAVHGHITLRKSERSALAAVAAEYL